MMIWNQGPNSKSGRESNRDVGIPGRHTRNVQIVKNIIWGVCMYLTGMFGGLYCEGCGMSWTYRMKENFIRRGLDYDIIILGYNGMFISHPIPEISTLRYFSPNRTTFRTPHNKARSWSICSFVHSCQVHTYPSDNILYNLDMPGMSSQYTHVPVAFYSEIYGEQTDLSEMKKEINERYNQPQLDTSKVFLNIFTLEKG